jgi:hypothetical protein
VEVRQSTGAEKVIGMLRLRLSLLFALAALTLLLLSLRIEIVDSSSTKIVDNEADLQKGSKKNNGKKAGEHPPITSLVFDHGTATPPGPASITASYPLIIRPDVATTTTDVASPPSTTEIKLEPSLASITATSSAPHTRLTDSPSSEKGISNKTGSALIQEEFQKEHDAIAS